jgi:hemerythrin superfamily protein
MYDPEKYAAVADNFIYVHRALRRDLSRIIEGGSELFESDFPRFARILAKHTELEDVLFFPALEERAPGSTMMTTDPHREIEALAEVLVAGGSLGDCTERLQALQALLEAHLAEEEELVMPAMMEHFEAAEIWALDGRIMEFCPPDFMQEMLPWWFTHIDADDRVAVAENMAVGVPPEVLSVLAQLISAGLSEGDWEELVEQVPALSSSAD